MIVRCWGARGSIPVSGVEYRKYGGDTTCLEIRTGQNNEILIVDAGSGTRRLANHMLAEKRYEFSFLFTHVHWDHILGFPFFKPIYLEQARLNIYGCPNLQGDLEKLLARTMDAPYFPVPYEVVRARLEYRHDCSESTIIDGIEISSIPLSHPNMGVGYKFTENGKTFVFLTDNELEHVHRGGRSFDDYVEFARGADLLFHDSEYTPEEYPLRTTWGHSTYTTALDLALAAGVKRFGLFHHNQDRPDAGVDEMVAHCQSIIAERGSNLDCFGVTQETEIRL
ncbi:MAG: MBL fold metallo-hydrolase [Proteobacteria bacterium]|nr:MBL fold metallo-hydrolase [Pseudomonadota bacterium]MBU1611743.1 MBL fold metallo-hydrolase [Pseudomonadota bacterium]